jgi:uncharacterized YccA/Bax inhibitor family protein
MKGLPLGSWEILNATFRMIGKGAAWVAMRKIGCDEECVAYAMIGGAVLCAVFCGAIGFIFSDHSGSAAAIAGAIIGGLLGVCIGIFFGASVGTVDSTIKHLLRSLNSK